MGRFLVQATWDDAPHLTQEQKDQLWESMPAHMRDARSKGIPALGSGAIFPISDDAIKCDPFPIPRHWPQIGGLDFGWDHPFAATRHAWDRDSDIFYTMAEYRKKEATPPIHVSAVKKWGEWIPFAWPHDGLQHDKGSGTQLAEQYRVEGLNLTAEKATFEDGSNGVEAGISEMLTRMQTGRWKVFSICTGWFEEKRMYHRKDGKIVKLRDDLISASRYALMMKRMAEVKQDEAYQMPDDDWVV